MCLWLTPRRGNQNGGQRSIDGDRKPAPGYAGGAARKVSGGFPGRNAIPASGTSVPAHRLASAGTGRRRSLGTGAWTSHEIARDADLRKIAPRDFFKVNGEPVRTTRGNRNRREQDSRLPLPGMLLSREWKGHTILVEVLAKGFRYESRPYSSLSAIAVAITGTRWNGLAFFGLTRPAGGQRKEQPGA
jgi:hypothetical protein